MIFFNICNKTSIHVFSRHYKYCLKMIGNTAINRIKQNADVAEKTIKELKNELEIINREYNTILSNQLQEENARLLAAVEEAKKKLIQLEVKNGVKQIPLPNQISCGVVTSKADDAVVVPQNETKKHVSEPVVAKEVKLKKEKKPKESKPAPEELPLDIGRLDLRIGKVETVERHPDADSLYLLKINCGEDKPRTVCSGLVKYVPMQELENRMVLLLCNLKPVKMRGVTSEAMVMCASSEAGVEVLLPPEGSQPGDLIQCDGYTRQPDVLMNPKKKIFETVAPDLHTNDDLQACYKGVPLSVPGKGFFVAKTLKNVAVK